MITPARRIDHSDDPLRVVLTSSQPPAGANVDRAARDVRESFRQYALVQQSIPCKADRARERRHREQLRGALYHIESREAGSRWLDAGVPLHRIRNWLGHANISQTSTYLAAVYHWLADPDFARRFEQTREEATTALEEEARRRALHGVDVPVIGWQGRDRRGVIATRREYSDRL